LRGRWEFPTEEFAVAVAFGPGEESEDDGFDVGDFALALRVLQIAAEAGEGGQAEAGIGDASDDVGRFRGFVRSPVVGDGFGDAAEFDDGEFRGECAFEGSGVGRGS